MKLLIWDFDGTLAYRPGLWASALTQALDEMMPGHGIGIEDLRPHLTSGFPWHQPDRIHHELSTADTWWDHHSELFAFVYAAVGVAPEIGVSCARRVRGIFCDAAGWSLFPDTIPALDRLTAAGWTHAVLSNHVPELPLIAEGLGIRFRFAEIVSSADIGYEKPHPEAFARVLERFPDRSATWMIGDNPVADVAGSRAVGIPSILVRQRHCCIVPCCDDLNGVVALLTGPSTDL